MLINTVLALTAMLTFAYMVLMHLYTHWFKRLKLFRQTFTLPVSRFSIIIPARDEEKTIGACLQSILSGTYAVTMYEIIVIDDHSTDNTAEVVEGFRRTHSNIQLIKLSEHVESQKLNAYKKKAVEIAIGSASNEWIVTTDADCILPEKWLHNFDNYIQQYDPVWIAAPVRFKTKKTTLSIFQSLDFLSLQGVTAASVSAGFHSMCNGANLCYKKEAFKSVGGFSGIDNVASGDDMLLMGKIVSQYPDRIGYLFAKSSVVLTAAMPSWKSFINQRIRWASKSTQYKDSKIFLVLLLVYFFNLLLVVLPFFALADMNILFYWLLFLGVKTLAEMRFMYYVTSFFRQRGLLKYFVFMQPMHVLYIVIAGWLGKFGSYQWKGRQVQ